MTIRFLTSGESHGKCLNAIIEGIGSGYYLDLDFINNELTNRQKGKGRGGRMKIETDKIEIKSGVRFQKTTGAPICIEIKNRDFENWKIPMSTEDFDFANLDDAAKKEIEDKLLATTPFDRMEMHYQVEEDLIGGMVIRIGDRVVDSSVKTKLFELQRELLKVQL